MTEKSIIYAPEMIRATLERRKPETRRVIKPQPEYRPEHGYTWYQRGKNMVWNQYSQEDFLKTCKYQPGDVLWVKEVYIEDQGVGGLIEKNNMDGGTIDVIYKADGDLLAVGWKSPVTMPRRASRITQEVLEVGVERLQDITDEGAIAEGLYFDEKIGGWTVGDGELSPFPRDAFFAYWDFLYAKQPEYQMHGNPWVWVIKTKPLEVG